jgi:hypothetical protein
VVDHPVKIFQLVIFSFEGGKKKNRKMIERTFTCLPPPLNLPPHHHHPLPGGKYSYKGLIRSEM